MSAILTAHDISYERYFSSVFGCVNIDLKAGSKLLLTGVNGAGKTTLLKVLAGILRPTNGHIHSSKASYSGHQSGLQPELTVLENLQFYQRLHGQRPNNENIRAVLSQLNANELALKNVRHLSAGQHKRAALARLCLIGHSVWLLDEPLVNLDQDSINKVLKILDQHTKARGIVVIASHSLGLEAFSNYPRLQLPANKAAAKEATV